MYKPLRSRENLYLVSNATYWNRQKPGILLVMTVLNYRRHRHHLWKEKLRKAFYMVDAQS